MAEEECEEEVVSLVLEVEEGEVANFKAQEVQGVEVDLFAEGVEAKVEQVEWVKPNRQIVLQDPLLLVQGEEIEEEVEDVEEELNVVVFKRRHLPHKS